ncbi:MAG: hypothetical protein HND56_00735 [Pseudomonadota bacterium]|nr:hypothetical protein [Pseudomonadota bacterium]QKK04292.1 MAG: hypothetical protein HND56_00735 [Pseudomonadota bacterium]
MTHFKPYLAAACLAVMLGFTPAAAHAENSAPAAEAVQPDVNSPGDRRGPGKNFNKEEACAKFSARMEERKAKMAERKKKMQERKAAYEELKATNPEAAEKMKQEWQAKREKMKAEHAAKKEDHKGKHAKAAKMRELCGLPPLKEGMKKGKRDVMKKSPKPEIQDTPSE